MVTDPIATLSNELAHFPAFGENGAVNETSMNVTGRANDSARALRILTTVASLGFVLTGVVSTFLGPILPALASRWALSDSQSGYFFALQFLGSVIGAGLSSMLLPLRGFRVTISLAHFMMALGVIGPALPQWTSALAGTFVFGVGFGLVIPSTNLLISGAHQNRRASALSILNLCWGLGALLTPAAVYLTVRQEHVGKFVVELCGLLALQAVSFLLISNKVPTAKEDKVEVPPLKNPNMRHVAILGGMFFLYVAIEASVGGWIATLAGRFASFTSSGWVLAPSLFYGGLLSGRGLTPLVLLKVRERRLALVGLMIAGLGMCTLVITSRWQFIGAAGFVIGLGLASVYPITIALLSRFGGKEKRNAGPLFALAGLGGSIMPWIVGVVSTWSGSLQAGLIVPLLATLILLWLHAVGNHGSQPALDRS